MDYLYYRAPDSIAVVVLFYENTYFNQIVPKYQYFLNIFMIFFILWMKMGRLLEHWIHWIEKGGGKRHTLQICIGK